MATTGRSANRASTGFSWIVRSTLAAVLGDPDHPGRPGDGPGLLGQVMLSGPSASPGQFEFLGGGQGVELAGGDGPVGQDSHDVVADLGETAVDEVSLVRPLRLRPQLSEAEPADQGRSA